MLRVLQSAVTHIDDAKKFTMVVDWQPFGRPRELVQVFFRASVVESFYKYWIRVDSQLVLVGDATSISKDVHFTTIGLTVFVCLFRFFGYQP